MLINLGGIDQMSQTGRIPLWIVATVAGFGVLAIVALFFYGSYAGVGSSL